MNCKIVNMRLNDIGWSQVKNFEMYCTISMSDYAGTIYNFSIPCRHPEKKLNLEHVILNSLMIITDKTTLNSTMFEDIILRVKLNENDSIIDIGHLMCDIWLNDKIEDEMLNDNNDLLKEYIEAERKNYELINNLKNLTRVQPLTDLTNDSDVKMNSTDIIDISNVENQIVYYLDHAELFIKHKKYGVISILIPREYANKALSKKWFYSCRTMNSKKYHHIYCKQGGREIKINKLLFFKNGQPKDVTENQTGPIEVNIRLDYRHLIRM